MDDMVDVIIVGAGPVGLTLAVALRRLSMSVRVVDMDSGTDREPRADVLFPRAGEALGAIGVGEQIRGNAYEMRGAQIFSNGRKVASFEVGRFDSRFPVAMTIEQHEIERLLAAELSRTGVGVEWNLRATDVTGHGDHVEVRLCPTNGDGEEVARAAWVVGCDGPRSTVRARLGIPFEGRPRSNMQVIQGNVIPAWNLRDEPGHGYFFLAPRRSVIAFPTPAGGYRIFCVRDDPDPDVKSTPTLTELRDLVAQTARLPELTMTLTEPVWLSRARFSDRVAAELRRGRVLLAGDAAHAWAPIGGHGMNVGILGAYNLAWKLAAVHHGEASDALLDSYCLEQRALAQGVIRDMRFNVMEMLLPPFGHRARSALLQVTMSAPRFQRRMEWMMSDFGRNHRASPVSWQRSSRPSRRGRRERAGDRVADAMVRVTPVGGSEKITSLHEVIGYDHWTLLVSGTNTDLRTANRLVEVCAASPAAIDVVTVTGEHTGPGHGLGEPGQMRLVRPDGHIGLVAPAGAVGVLRSYLETYVHATTGAATDREPAQDDGDDGREG